MRRNACMHLHRRSNEPLVVRGLPQQNSQYWTKSYNKSFCWQNNSLLNVCKAHQDFPFNNKHRHKWKVDFCINISKTCKWLKVGHRLHRAAQRHKQQHVHSRHVFPSGFYCAFFSQAENCHWDSCELEKTQWSDVSCWGIYYKLGAKKKKQCYQRLQHFTAPYSIKLYPKVSHVRLLFVTSALSHVLTSLRIYLDLSSS